MSTTPWNSVTHDNVFRKRHCIKWETGTVTNPELVILHVFPVSCNESMLWSARVPPLRAEESHMPPTLQKSQARTSQKIHYFSLVLVKKSPLCSKENVRKSGVTHRDNSFCAVVPALHLALVQVFSGCPAAWAGLSTGVSSPVGAEPFGHL